MKRLSSGTWFLISLLLLGLGVFFWLWGNRVQDQPRGSSGGPDIVITNGHVVLPQLGRAKYQLATRLGDEQLRNAFSAPAPRAVGTRSTLLASIPADPRFPYRLRNTKKSVSELSQDDAAILLNNATIDADSRIPLGVPAHLRAASDTRSYLLQSVGAFDEVFDEPSLKRLGIEKVAYIPHNTWIVRMSPDMSRRLQRFAGTRSVRPFEPYFKLSDSLLEFAVLQADIPGIITLQLTLFKGAEEAMFQELEAMGTEYVQEGVSPFGPTVMVKTERRALSEIASLDGVLTVERVERRTTANDLTRVRIGVDTALTNAGNTNFHELTGKDILVNVNDTGVDANHPDLQGRVFSIDNANLRDADGHGTHVAGTIASTGNSSPMVTNVFGSATNSNFRGMAPESEIFVLPIDLITGPLVSDAFLQEKAAEYNYVTQNRTNALISNNSWTLRNVREYNSSAAAYDAAVRDALPEVEGSQPIVYVFAAGNTGSGNEEGRGGEPATIAAPGTAKNVITVGSLESLRFITNEVVTGFIDEVMTNDLGMAVTNQTPILERVFEPPTDSATQVSSFSSRGNVGIGIEGDFGRYKPDVVAPGSFTISTAATNWTTPEQFVDVTPNTISNQTAQPGELVPYTMFAREGTVEIEISVVENAASPDSFPRMPIYAQYGTLATTNNLVGFNRVVINEDESSPIPVQPGVLFYSVGAPGDDPVTFDIETRISIETESDGYFDELATLNEGLSPTYRFESGTSMAAPAVSGLLALFQEFLRDNGHNASPALLKALLINGSRTASELYDFQIDPVINFQGWGAVNLGNSLPNSMFQSQSSETQATLQFFDQSVEDALATGEHRSWNLNLNTNEARALPLRLTLVWTDPPGNPAAGIKLVNDLDLVVSNTVSGEIFHGNNFRPAELFTAASTTNSPPVFDNVNNVENVFISPPLGTNYVVSVVARRVNVNSVTDHPDGVVQDFALVVSSGDNPDVEAPFELEPIEELEPEYVEIPALVSITNSIPRLSDRVGANAPLLGTTNGLIPQWQFYVFTNSLPSTNDVGFTNGPNVAFVTFLPPNLARPRNLEADVDLFVSRDAGLLDLNENVMNNALRSTMPGGSEVVILTNQPLGDDVVYYIGVKSEDHQAGQYAFVGISREDPFDEEDENGNRRLNGVPLNQGIIPDGSPNEPGAALTLVLGNPLNGLTVQSATAELSLVHEDIGDLLGNVSHNGVSVVLNNHTLFNPDGTFGDLDIIYDDFGTRVPSFPTDGPGSLINFIGENGTGVWLMSMVDNALTHTGQVFGFNMILTPNRLVEGEGLVGVVQPESFSYFVIEVPTDASALDVNLTEFALPLDLYLRREELPTQSQFDKRALGTNDASNLTLRLTRTDIPPLNPGQYFVGIYNPNLVPVEFRLTFNFERNLIIDAEQPFFAEELEVPITDDAVTKSSIFVADTRGVADVKVGLRIDHPRASDLTMHLVSPLGTRVLLSENRGGTEATGWGAGSADLATFGGFSDNPDDFNDPIKFARPPFSTNSVVEVTKYSGFEEVRSNRAFDAGDTFLANTDSNIWEVLEGRTRVVGGANGPRAAEGRRFLSLGSARVATLMPTEPGKKVDLFFSTRSSAGRGESIGRVFLDGARAQVVDGSFDWRRNTPVRFTPGRSETLLELSIIRGRPPMQVDDIELRDAAGVKFFQPEEELASFDGQPAVGDWTLEIWDNRAGAVEPAPMLQNWQLLMSLAQTNFPATALSNGQCVTNTVIGDEIQYYIVDVPRIATIATNWLTGTGDLVLLWNEDGIPMGESPPDVFPPIDFNGEDAGEGMVLATSGISLFEPSTTNQIARFPAPQLRPGQRYYLGVKNADPDAENQYELCLQFDQDDVQVITLTNAIAFTNTIPFLDDLEFQYYRYRAGSNVLSMDIEIFPEDGDVNAVEKFGLPLPNLSRFDNRADEMGLDAELINITNKAPATILPGDYYIGVYNVEPNRTDVRYSILVTETTAPYNIIRLPQLEPIDFSVNQNITTEENLLENYFLISITNPAVSQARIDITNLTESAQLILQKDALPTLDDNVEESLGRPELPGSGRIVLRTNDLRPSLVGDWFVGVVNDKPDPLDFTIIGSTFTNDVLVTDLPNLEWVTNTVVRSVSDQPREVDYYRFVVSDQALDVSFTVEPIIGGNSADVDLYVRQGGLPTETEFDGESAFRGAGSEAIAYGPGTDGGPVVPGEWLLAVVNDESQPVTYRIRVIQNIDLSVPRLRNGIWVTNSIAPPPEGQLPVPDYYVFNVLTSATSATFDLEPLVDSGPGNLDLFIRFGDLPDLANFDAVGINLGTDPESITLTPTSTPPLTPGRWFVGVLNREGVPVPYRVRATQIVPPPPPSGGPVIVEIDPEVSLVGDDICLTWPTIPGERYYVQGKQFQSDPEWTTIHGPIVTSLDRWTQCFPNTIPYQFFRIIYFEGDPPPDGTFVDTGLEITPDEVCVTWLAFPGTIYTVQAKATIDDPEWQTLSVLEADDLMMKFCVDRPTDLRVFRVAVGRLVPPVDQFVDPVVVVDNNQLCLQWPAELGQVYTIEGKRSIDDGSWTAIDVIRADALNEEYCLNLPSDFRFFRIRRGGDLPEFIDPVLVLDDNQICLQWMADVGQTYTIEGKVAISDGSWTALDVVQADAINEEYCVNLPTDFRFFRIRRGGELPTVPEFIDPVLDIGLNDICLTWQAEPGRRYIVQGQVSLADAGWTDLTTILADEATERFCLALPTDFRFFRVQVGDLVPPTIPEFVEPTIRLTDTELCVDWASTAGFDYVVEAKADLSADAWTSVAVVSATGEQSQHCISLPTDFRFFRIRVIGETPVDTVVFVEPGLTLNADEICLDWAAIAGQTYVVQGKRSVADADWTELGVVLAESELGEFCVSLPTEFRFFRVAVSDTEPDPEEPVAGRVLDPQIGFNDNQVCLSWDAVAGGRYAIQGRAEILDVAWTTVAEVTAADAMPSFCLDLTTELRFFRIVELALTPPPVDPPAATTGFVDPFVRLMADQLCVDWASQPGVEYAVQVKDRIDAGEWTTVETVTADGDSASVCLSEIDAVGFFRVAILEGEPVVAPPVVPAEPLAIGRIQRTDSGVTISWTADSSQTFIMEFSDVIPPVWNESDPITSDSGEFTFSDTGSGPGGPSPTRYYRLREQP